MVFSAPECKLLMTCQQKTQNTTQSTCKISFRGCSMRSIGISFATGATAQFVCRSVPGSPVIENHAPAEPNGQRESTDCDSSRRGVELLSYRNSPEGSEAQTKLPFLIAGLFAFNFPLRRREYSCDSAASSSFRCVPLPRVFSWVCCLSLTWCQIALSETWRRQQFHRANKHDQGADDLVCSLNHSISWLHCGILVKPCFLPGW